MRASALSSVPVVVLALVGGIVVFAMQGRGATPALALIDESTLTVLRGLVEVQQAGGSFQTVTADTTVRVGTRIRTGADSYAVVTYFDGSATELEPNTDIEIRRLDRTPAGGQAASFRQEIGQTWNRVERLADPASRFEGLQPPPSRLYAAPTSALSSRLTWARSGVSARGQPVASPPTASRGRGRDRAPATRGPPRGPTARGPR